MKAKDVRKMVTNKEKEKLKKAIINKENYDKRQQEAIQIGKIHAVSI